MDTTSSDDRLMLRQLRRVLTLAEEALEQRTAPAAPTAPTAPNEAASLREEAVGLEEIEARMSFGDSAAALGLLRGLIERRPHAAAYILLASIERREGKLDEAARAADEAARLARRELARSRCEHARVLVDAGRTDAARADFNEAHELCPELVEALVGLGSLALAGGDSEQAERRFRRALELDKSARTLAGLGLALIARGRPRDALEPLEQALDIEADCVTAVYGMVQVAFQTGELSRAERRVRAFVELHGGNLDMIFTLAGLRSQLGDRAGAHEMLERIELFDPAYPGLVELRDKLR